MTDDGIDEKDINGHMANVAKSALFDIIVVSSQTPIGTARAWQKKYPKVRIVYFPEFLRFGDALKRFVEPDYIVLGGDAAAVKHVLSFFERIVSPKFTVSLEEAEMSKHAANTFVATTVSFISELSKFSEHFNINFENIGKILRADKRVGPKAYTLPGLGFTGTVGRDFKVLKKVGKKLGIKLPLFKQVVAVNNDHNLFIERELKRTLKNVKGKRIAFLGATYKPFTSNLRGSIIEPLMKKLNRAGAEVVLFDPMVESSYQVPTIEDAYRKADALVMVVPKKEFLAADHKALVRTMRKKIIIDAANMIPKTDAPLLGANYRSIARGILSK
jgi:UDPglucose 6-dehydrogenase